MDATSGNWWTCDVPTWVQSNINSPCTTCVTSASALASTALMTGAGSQAAQTTTTKLNGGVFFPTTDSTAAMQFDRANGTSNVMTVDTTDGYVGNSGKPVARRGHRQDRFVSNLTERHIGHGDVRTAGNGWREDLNLLPKRLCGDGRGADVQLSDGVQHDSGIAGKRGKLRHVQPELDDRHVDAAGECLHDGGDLQHRGDWAMTGAIRRADGLRVICGHIRLKEKDLAVTHAINVDKHGGFAPGRAARQPPPAWAARNTMRLRRSIENRSSVCG